MEKLLITLFLVLGLALPAQAQSTRILTVSGRGTVLVRPDMAQISIGAESVAPTADRALRANSARVGAILAVLKVAGVADRDIATTQLSLQPRFERTRNDDPLRITGFVVSNVLIVRIRSLDRLGATLDQVVTSGANLIHSIQFDISDPAPHLNEARRAAVAEAMDKARVIAEAAGLTLGPVLAISEDGAEGPQPMFRREALAMSADAVPIAEGELDLRASVTIQFAIE